MIPVIQGFNLLAPTPDFGRSNVEKLYTNAESSKYYPIGYSVYNQEEGKKGCYMWTGNYTVDTATDGWVQWLTGDGKFIINGKPISIDNILNINSENPVQNKVITTKINTIDSTIETIKRAINYLGPSIQVKGIIDSVQNLPEKGIPGDLYLVKKQVDDGLAENYYDEYLWVQAFKDLNNKPKWELIGTTGININDYVKKTEFNTAIINLENTKASKNLATLERDGLMPKEMFTKIDDLETSKANKSDVTKEINLKATEIEDKIPITDTELSEDSMNPIANKPVCKKLKYLETSKTTQTQVDYSIRNALAEKNFATNDRVDEIANNTDVLSSVEGNLMIGGTTSGVGTKGKVTDSGRKVVDSLRNDSNVPSNRAVLAHLDKFNVVMGSIDGTITPEQQQTEAKNKRYRNLMAAVEYVDAPNEKGLMIPGWQYQIETRDTYLNLGIVPPSSPEALKYAEPGDVVICKTAGRYTSSDVSSSGYGYPTFVVMQSTRKDTTFSVQNQSQFIDINDSNVNEKIFSSREDFVVEKVRLFESELNSQIASFLSDANEFKYYFINLNINQKWWEDGGDKFALSFVYDAIANVFNKYYYIECIDLNINNTNGNMSMYTDIQMSEVVGNANFNDFIMNKSNIITSAKKASPLFILNENKVNSNFIKVRISKIYGINGNKESLKFSISMN